MTPAARSAGSNIKLVLEKKIIIENRDIFFKPFQKTGAATVTPVQYFVGWRLPHQHYTDQYNGRHTTFSNTMYI